MRKSVCCHMVYLSAVTAVLTSATLAHRDYTGSVAGAHSRDDARPAKLIFEMILGSSWELNLAVTTYMADRITTPHITSSSGVMKQLRTLLRVPQARRGIPILQVAEVYEILFELPGLLPNMRVRTTKQLTCKSCEITRSSASEVAEAVHEASRFGSLGLIWRGTGSVDANCPTCRTSQRHSEVLDTVAEGNVVPVIYQDGIHCRDVVGKTKLVKDPRPVTDLLRTVDGDNNMWDPMGLVRHSGSEEGGHFTFQC